MKKIFIVGTVGVPACYGGFESLVENLLDHSDDQSLMTVYCSSKAYDNKISTYKNARLVYLPLNANGFQSILYDILSIFHAAFSKADSILILGVSGAICLPLIKFISKSKVVTNIDGLEWKRDKWHPLIKRYLKFSERIAVNFSDEVVTDNQAIAEYVSHEYGKDSEVIAYGGDHSLISELSHSDNNYALALCRIEPENNVEMILEAFSRMDKKINFVGNWSNSSFGKEMKLKYSGFKNIELIDPIYNLDLLFELRQNCSFYVHGHSAGGTNPSLVEMMHFEKPILAFNCSYNRATTENKALFFSSVCELSNQINHDFKGIPTSALKEIAERRYTWKIVRQQYVDLLLNGDKKLK